MENIWTRVKEEWSQITVRLPLDCNSYYMSKSDSEMNIYRTSQKKKKHYQKNIT